MSEWILDHSSSVRFTCFLTVLAVLAILEIVAPKRNLTVSKMGRWTVNLTLTVLNTGLMRLALPMAAMGVVLVAKERNWGWLNNTELPFWVEVVIAVLLFDAAIYLQHVLFHAVPVLWRLHMVHHADIDLDVTSGARFHPVEIFLSMLIKLGALILIGAPALAVLIFEVLLNATAMFNHSNVRIAGELDRILRWMVVTPDMHRVHHSTISRETNSNFGFNLPWWDRLCGTYREQPSNGHRGMTIGLTQFRDPNRLKLLKILTLPFAGKTGAYAINRRDFGQEKSNDGN